MKILHIIYDDIENPWVGGGGAVRAWEINRLLSKKHTICMVTGKFPGARSCKMEGMHFERIGFGRHYFLSRLTFTLLTPFYLRKFDFDLIVNDFSIFSPVFCQWFTRKPVVHLFHHFIGWQVFRKFWIVGILSFLAEKIFLASAKNVITVSQSLTRKIGKTKDTRRIVCINNGVDSSLFDCEPAQGEYIAFLGRLDIYMKGLDILLEAFHKLPNTSVVLKIAGSGPKKNRVQIKHLRDRHRLKNRVELLGRISDEQKKEYLRRAAFFVMPSRFEGWGITAIEAAACGKAVIGTDIPGLQDAIVNGKTGLLVEPDNSEALAGAMQTLLGDDELCASLGRGGREWAQNFKWDTIAEKQEAFYKEIVNE